MSLCTRLFGNFFITNHAIWNAQHNVYSASKSKLVLILCFSESDACVGTLPIHVHADHREINCRWTGMKTDDLNKCHPTSIIIADNSS